MASLTFARPGKVSERQYLGDLVCLLDRHRRRSGLALTRDSMAADLAASDALRSALFTLCTAISRMGENDLTPEELLVLVARALESGDGVDAPAPPPEMRDAFLSGFAAWQSRGLQPFGPSGDWPALDNDSQSIGRDSVLPFPGRKTDSFKVANDGRLRANPQIPAADAADDRPCGIDALVAAAPVWANAVSPARSSFNKDAARHMTPSAPLRVPAVAPASLCYDNELAETPPVRQALTSSDLSAAPAALSAAALVFLRDESTEEATSPSPFGRVQAFLLRLPPRKVFFALAGLTILAGALAGVMAYRTLHTGLAPQLKDFEPTVAYAGTATAHSIPAGEKPANGPQKIPATVSRTATHRSPPDIPQRPAVNFAALQLSLPAPLNIPAPTMIGYALATPQPVGPTPRVTATPATVAVDIVISRLGDVTSAKAVSGPLEFYPASLLAVRGWRFRPYLVDGRPVEVATTLQFAF